MDNFGGNNNVKQIKKKFWKTNNNYIQYTCFSSLSVAFRPLNPLLDGVLSLCFCKVIRNVVYYFTGEIKQMFYNAYLVPIFDDCFTVWGNCYKRYINKVNSLQKRAARLTLNKPVRTPTPGRTNRPPDQ